MNTGQQGRQQQSKSRRKRVVTAILALLLLVVTGVLFVAHFGEWIGSGSWARSGIGQKEEEKSLVRVSNVAARAHAVRNVRARLLGRTRDVDSPRQAGSQPRPSNEELGRALTHPVNIKKELEAGNEKWLATVVSLEDFFFAREARLECASAVEGEVRNGCLYSLDMSVERTGPTQGVIRLANADASGNDGEALCQLFAECLASGRLGQSVDLPEGSQMAYGFKQRVFSPLADAESSDPAKLAEMIDTDRVLLDELKAKMSPNSTKDKYMLLTNTMILKAEEALLHEVQTGKRHQPKQAAPPSEMAPAELLTGSSELLIQPIGQ